MVSTLKLTKIQIPNSDSDVLSFNSSTGIMTFHKDIKGEGNATTNLQQGLTKHWCNYNADGSSVNDSFNNSSMSDYATCNYGYNFTNNMGNNDYCPSGFIRDGSDNTHLRCVQSIDTSNFTTSVITIRPAGVNASAYLTNFDPIDVTLHITGDLA